MDPRGAARKNRRPAPGDDGAAAACLERVRKGRRPITAVTAVSYGVMMRRPARSEAADYYFGYIDQVPGSLILSVLASQLGETLGLLESISEEQSLHRYASDKWTIRQVLNHMNDAERLFVSRAFWFARGFDSPLPSFDQNVATAAAGANDLQWRHHVDDFRAVRGATLTFFRGLPPAAWNRGGIASDLSFSVRALAYIAAGHVIHHSRVLRERYLNPS
jgi:hypothetical protein